MRFLGVLAFAAACAFCANSARSSPTPPGNDILVIVPSIYVLQLNEMQTLSAVVVSSGDGTKKPVAASWSSDSPSIVAIGQDGQVGGLAPGTATIRANYQALSATRMISVVRDHARAWNGSYQITNCTCMSGDGPDVCRAIGP
jgi:Bacterial Ig-like domain (group 2)